MLRVLALSLLLLAAPAAAYENPECAWAPAFAKHCCNEHALAYMIGGTEEQRLRVDHRLKLCLEASYVDELMVEAAVGAAREFGGPTCRGRRCWRYPSTPAEAYRVYHEGLGWGHSYQKR